MATLDTETIDLNTRSETGSRAMRRLRRAGRVPGILYGGGDDPVPFDVDARLLRNALAHSGALLQVTLDGGGSLPIQIKDVQRDPVRGDLVHADFVRVSMDTPMQAPVTVEIAGAEKAPGVVDGGVLTQELTQVTVEALPGDLPETIAFDASNLQVAETVLVGQVELPPRVTLVDDPELVLLSITAPTREDVETDALETEVAVVGDEAQGQASGDTGDVAAGKADSDGDAS